MAEIRVGSELCFPCILAWCGSSLPLSSWETPWLLWNIHALPAVSGVPVLRSLLCCAFAPLVQTVTTGWSLGLCMKLAAERGFGRGLPRLQAEDPHGTISSGSLLVVSPASLSPLFRGGHGPDPKLLRAAGLTHAGAPAQAGAMLPRPSIFSPQLVLAVSEAFCSRLLLICFGGLRKQQRLI